MYFLRYHRRYSSCCMCACFQFWWPRNRWIVMWCDRGFILRWQILRGAEILYFPHKFGIFRCWYFSNVCPCHTSNVKQPDMSCSNKVSNPIRFKCLRKGGGETSFHHMNNGEIYVPNWWYTPKNHKGPTFCRFMFEFDGHFVEICNYNGHLPFNSWNLGGQPYLFLEGYGLNHIVYPKGFVTSIYFNSVWYVYIVSIADWWLQT